MIKNIQDKTVLRDGTAMPWFGLGLWQVEDADVLDQAVQTALSAGYISFDTASAYRNESYVGRSLARAEVSRDKLFITTKLWNRDQVKGRAACQKALKDSLRRLKMEAVDLYLIHWPVPAQGKYIEAWQALIDLQQAGLTRSIGVSNFHIHHLKKLEKETGVIPAVNQVELHPWLSQKPLLDYCRQKHIQVEAYSPLMGGHLAEEPALAKLADRYNKTPAQVVLRWHLQNEVVCIPKSVHEHRIRENAAVFDFDLSTADMAAIDGLNRDHRFLPDPDEMDFY